MTAPGRRPRGAPAGGPFGAPAPPPVRADELLDARGLLCPLPIVETAKAVARLAVGQILEIRSDDFGVLADMPAWCKGTGHELVAMREEPGLVLCWVRRTR